MLSIIVAKSKNNVIGKDNKLLWKISDDLKRFKNLTEYHTIIMGRKTFESLGRILPNRKHVVLTHNLDYEIDNENVEIVNSIHDLDKYINSKEECFVIGGGLIYTLLLPFTQKLYITQIDKEYEGDTFFPKINLLDWDEIGREEILPNDQFPYKYEYITYLKKCYNSRSIQIKGIIKFFKN